MTTIEEQISTLAHSVEAIASELNSRRGVSPNKSAAVMPPKVALTKNLADFDFAEIEASRGCKVVAIIKAPEFVPATARHAVLNVELANGKKALVKAPFRASQTSKSTPTATAPTPSPRPSVAAIAESDAETIAAAAMNIESRVGSSEAWKSFCGFTFQKGKSACNSVVMPLLAVAPFPAGSLPHEKVNHTRALMVKHVLPEVHKVAGVSQVAPVEQIAQHLPGTLAAWQADASLRDPSNGGFASFRDYQAFVGATGDAATRHRIRLEREAKIPRLVHGEWALGKIGAHEEAWLNDPKLQVEFPTPEGYAAYKRRMG